MTDPAVTVRLFHQSDAPLFKKAGETIFAEGEMGKVMFGLLTGDVDLVVKGKVVETIQAGDIFGEGALVQPSKLRASTAIARSDCSLVCLNRTRFLFAVENTPMFAVEVLHSYFARLRRLKNLI